MARQFGIITTVNGITSLVVTSFSEKQNVEIAQARNSDGRVTDLKAYSLGRTVTIRGFLDDASCNVQAGDSLTLGSQTYLVESVSRNESNTAYAEVDITARNADAASVGIYSAETAGN